MKPMDEAVFKRFLSKSCPDHLYTTVIAQLVCPLSHNISLLWELLTIKPVLQHLLDSLCVAFLSQHHHLFKTMSIVKHRVQLVHTKRYMQ